MVEQPESRRRRTKRVTVASFLVLMAMVWQGEITCAYAQSLSSITQSGSGSSSTGASSAFYGASSDGGSFAQSLFSGAKTGMTTQQGTVSSFTGGAGSTYGSSGGPYFNNLQGYYVPDSTSTSDGLALNSASSANAALMNAACPASWTQTMASDFQTTATPQVSAAVARCSSAAASLAQSALAAGMDALTQASFQAALQALRSASSQLQSLTNVLSSDCATAPSCNLVGPTNLQSGAGALTAGAGTLSSACNSLPAAVTSATAGNAIADLNAAAADANAMLSSQPVNLVKDDCEYGAAYAQSHGLYADVNAYSANPTTNIISSMMNNPSQIAFVNEMLNATYPTAASFSNYFSGCTTTSTTTRGAGTSATETSPSTTPGNTAPATPVQVCGNYSGGNVYWNAAGNDAWHNVYFPDGAADAINQDCNVETQGASASYAYTYVNNGSASQPATVDALCNDQCTIQVNGATILSYNDDGNVGSNVTANFSFQPGPNQIVVANTNDSGYFGVMLAFYDASTGSLLFDTNGSWTDPGAPNHSGGGAPTTTSTTVSIPTASTTQLSTSCNAVINCMGTDCYNVSDPADQSFPKTATALQALKMMQTDVNCAAGTSIQAGNCQPLVFTGNMQDCRTWPSYASGTGFTGNCCNEGLMAPAPPIGEYIKGIYDVYNIATTPSVDAWAMSIMPVAETVNGVKAVIAPLDNWSEGAYSSMTTWAGDAWQYVSSPFESVGSDISSMFGVAGGQSAATVSSLAGAGASTSQSVTYSGLLGPIKSAIYDGVQNMLQTVFGSGPDATALIQDAMAPFAPSGTSFLAANGAQNAVAHAIAGFAGDLMLAYAVYQLATMITSMLTACTNAEFELGYNRKEDDCSSVGSYCAVSVPVLGCVETQHVFCCYANPLSEIIASQIREFQPSVAGNYGTARNPNCGGFTPTQLAAVNWSEINLSAWTAMLAQAGIMTSTDAEAQAVDTPNAASHPSGDDNSIAQTVAPGQSGTVTDQNGTAGDSALDNLEREFSAQGNGASSTTSP